MEKFITDLEPGMVRILVLFVVCVALTGIAAVIRARSGKQG